MLLEAFRTFPILSVAAFLIKLITCQSGIEVCHLPVQRGPCNSLSTRYYYSTNFHRCLPFFYGGCQGNGNNFRTKDRCLSICQRDNKDDFIELHPRPKNFSACATLSCGKCFECLINRFQEPKCVRKPNCCPGPDDEQVSCRVDPCIDRNTICPQSTRCVSVYCKDQCEAVYYDDFLNQIFECPRPDLNVDSCRDADCGPCGTCIPDPRNIKSYSCTIDRNCEEQRQCAIINCPQKFTCKIVAGVARCVGNTESLEARKLKVCRQLRMEGSCNQSQVKYYHDPFVAKCYQFNYSGCKGNENRFDQLDQCEQFCADMPPCPAFTLPPAPRACQYVNIHSSTTFCPLTRLDCGTGSGLDNTGGFLKRGSCPELGNEWGCESRCRSDTQCPSDEKCCQTECGGQVCRPPFNPLASLVDADKQRICRLPRETGSCRASIRKFFYDGLDCRRFVFGGCQGNENQFETIEECRNFCKGVRPCPVPALIQAPPRCRYVQRNSSDACEVFDLVCESDPNSDPCFSSPCQDCEECRVSRSSGFECIINETCLSERLCSSIECPLGSECQLKNGQPRCEKLEPELRSVSAAEIGTLPTRCLLRPQKGPCDKVFPSWFYDRVSEKCDQFDYGGCQGNSNRFETKEWCERVCIEQKDCPPKPKPSKILPPNCAYNPHEMDKEGCIKYELNCTSASFKVATENSSGICPAPSFHEGNQQCIFQCNVDSDCRPGLKCCPNICGRTCKPAVPSNRTTVCPGRQQPPAPSNDCIYREITLSNGCIDFELFCDNVENGSKTGCESNPCRACEKCIPDRLICSTKPCPQYRCESRCGLCESCNKDGECESTRVTCRALSNPCINTFCPKFPNARCIQDECDCTQARFVDPNKDNREITLEECLFGPRL